MMQIDHITLHSEKLLQLYPDLNVSPTIFETKYFSKTLNADVDEFEFSSSSMSTYVYIHKISPFKNVQIDCPKCNGLVRVNSEPHELPILIEHELTFRTAFNLYTPPYQDIIKSANLSEKTLTAVQLHIISKLEEHHSSKHTLDLLGLNDSIKKLLPFM